MSYTVALVDDHILIAKAIAGIIDNFAKYEVLYEVENGKALIEKFKLPKNIPDIVLLDIAMPVMDGFETAKWIKENHPEVLVLALSMQDDEQSLIKMIKSGAKGYLLKNVHPTELEKALDTLVAKGFYYPDWVTNKIFLSIADEQHSTDIVMTDREKEFLQHCCSELTYKEIGEKMFCSNRTVEGYRDSLFEKLGLKTRVGLVMYAIKSGYHSL
ncbi:MAG: response regulator transcription factor [Bacteroidetes bacterium]|nr:response regulator transcription factor [Bacteroidota bacterium]